MILKADMLKVDAKGNPPCSGHLLADFEVKWPGGMPLTPDNIALYVWALPVRDFLAAARWLWSTILPPDCKDLLDDEDYLLQHATWPRSPTLARKVFVGEEMIGLCYAFGIMEDAP